jgi:hypothetical protein
MINAGLPNIILVHENISALFEHLDFVLSTGSKVGLGNSKKKMKLKLKHSFSAFNPFSVQSGMQTNSNLSSKRVIIYFASA